MKSLVFDTGPVITFALNGLLPMFTLLRKKYAGDFLISNDVYTELIETPLRGRRFAFEAMQVQDLINKKQFTLYDTSSYSEETALITKLANSIFSARGKDLTILNAGELDALVLAKNVDAEAVVVDERTTRLIIENPKRLHGFLEKKFRTKVSVDKQRLKEFSNHFSSLKIIRSVELALMCVDFGFMDDLIKTHTSRQVVE